MTVMPLNIILCGNFSTFLQHPQLSGDLAQSADDFLVPLCKTKDDVRYPDLGAKPLDILLRPAQVMSRNARVQMVDDLELETTVDEVQPGRTVDIHGRPEHLLSE